MQAHDIRKATQDLPKLSVTPDATSEDATGTIIASFNQCMVGVLRFSGEAPWERHPDDEMLHVLDGEVDVTLLTDGGPIREPPRRLHLRRAEGRVAPAAATPRSEFDVRDVRRRKPGIDRSRPPVKAAGRMCQRTALLQRASALRRRRPEACRS